MDEKKRRSLPEILLALLKAGCYLLLFLGSQVLVTIVFTIGVTLALTLEGSAMAPDAMMDGILAFTPHITLFSAILTLAVLTGFFLLRKKDPLREAGLVRTRPVVVGAAASMTPALYVLVILVLACLPEAWMESYAEASAGLSDTGLFSFLATVIAAPIVEEVIFRGLIQSRLGRVMPGWLAAVLAALVFGLCHGQAVWVGYAFVLGLFFGWFTLRSGSILPSMLAHFVFNAIGHFAVVLESRVPDWTIFAALLAISAVGCLLTRRGLAHLFAPRPAQPEVP